MKQPEPISWLGEGWAGVNAVPPTIEERARDQEAMLLEFEDARLFHDVFAVGRGPELVEHLRERLFETPATMVTGKIGHDQLEFAVTPQEWLWIRLGQNSVLHHIRAMIEKARRGPPVVEAEAKGANGHEQSEN